MELPGFLVSLERFGRALPVLLRDVSVEDSRWKPLNGAWSVLEIVSHLADEEEFDFGVRVKLTLFHPQDPWPSINPEGWAVERRYNEGELSEALERFVALRSKSLTWLRALDAPDWSRAHQHPQHGAFRAGDILAAWVAHDQLHLRQIAKRLYQLAERDAGEYSIRYAGEWSA